ncbi:MarC family protein [Chlamydia vaughanii]|uniref:MarC family protein n=1 Tax=Chlamydia vaughanii TaxID=3112552 RepID=UPI0032B20926
MNSVSFLLPQACILLLAADTLTNVLVLNLVLSRFSRKERLLLLVKESFFALLGMFALYWAALGTLHVLKTPLCAIQAVGGIAVTLSGLRAVLNLSKENSWKSFTTGTSLSSVTPIALPLMIGPSWLAACCILVGKNYNFASVSFILVLSWILISLTTILLQVFVGGGQGKAKVLLATQTVLGLFVTIVGTQLLLSGLQQAFL